METIASGSNGWNELIVGKNNGVTLQETLIERLVSQRYRRKDMNLSKSQSCGREGRIAIYHNLKVADIV
ncbi:unnamed protein product [Calypogeia fissa]